MDKIEHPTDLQVEIQLTLHFVVQIIYTQWPVEHETKENNLTHFRSIFWLGFTSLEVLLQNAEGGSWAKVQRE